jgi:hypothetical protein
VNGQQASASIHVTLETGAVRNSYELILNYEYTDPESGARKTGRIDGELTSGDYAPTPTPYPTYTPFPTPTFTPQPTYTPNPTYTPYPTPTFTPYPTYTPVPTFTPYQGVNVGYGV